MAKIEVQQLDDTKFRVTVEGPPTTNHEVTVDHPYVERLTGGWHTTESLLEQTFKFMLKRESNTLILKRFELTTLPRYFPDYERKIKEMLDQENEVKHG
jgi:hypothetical protein